MMKNSFKITPKGSVSTLLQSLSEAKTSTLSIAGDPFASCLAMVASKRPEISLA